MKLGLLIMSFLIESGLLLLVSLLIKRLPVFRNRFHGGDLLVSSIASRVFAAMDLLERFGDVLQLTGYLLCPSRLLFSPRCLLLLLQCPRCCPCLALPRSSSPATSLLPNLSPRLKFSNPRSKMCVSLCASVLIFGCILDVTNLHIRTTPFQWNSEC